ncbi:MAG: Coenzyme F420-dependent oxidoreductase [uncultured Thermomicrobiales bacterium]|uniref:Coenzyme F420-dependent oxidoreductase n=1 Tax=uncultured Thermomicrobiales bacterium TaxID=1645740 RepID=A0A6J4VAV5_9BACT|nr:MAG: Coenzyme F420-dependent oxidoreductase [uncultured Thermomicrobiales bacterium]
MKPLRFGIKTAPQHTTYGEMLALWEEADNIPAIEHAWLFDHYAPIHSDVDGPCLEGWTTLAAFAARTKRLRLGLMVTGNTYRHPAVLTKIAITTDIISGGRLDFGIGAGWNEYEHSSMGIPLYAPGERIRRLDEACEIYKRLCTEHLTTFDGRYYQLKEARSEPKPTQRPYPPITIGGSGEQLTLRVVAKHADIWNFAGGSVETFQHKDRVLREHCAVVGRDPEAIERSIQTAVNYDDLDATVATVQSFVDVGATHLILNLRPPFPAGIVTRLAEEVIPRIKQG